MAKSKQDLDASSIHSRILSLDELIDKVRELRADGKRVVQCHGVFDLLHVGHVRHFESARAHGDALVITVTADEHVNRGPDRPRFPLALRLEAVAALHGIDYVAANSGVSAADAIRSVQPDIYARGPDYRTEVTVRGSPLDEATAARDVGAEFIVTEDISFAAASLVNNHIALPSEETRGYLDSLALRYPPEALDGWLETMRKLKVLVVGEAIIDTYSYVETIGKTSKDPLLATRHRSTERYAGGILAVANNVANFVESINLVTVLGQTETEEGFIRGSLNERIGLDFVLWPGAPTIEKKRFVDNYTLSKLFEVYEMGEGPLPEEQVAELNRKLQATVPGYDLVIVVDFGHGMMTKETIEVICEQSRYLALNVQTNAGNHPYNVLSRYRRADFISAADQELRLEARDPLGDLRGILHDVARRLSAKQSVATRGKYGCLCMGVGEPVVEIPSLATQVVDRVGAGDAFLSIAALASAAGAPTEVVGLFGSAASAQAVATLGHQRSVDPTALVQLLTSVLR